MPNAQPDQLFRHKRVTVLGLGRFGGGIGVSRYLHAQGAKVLVTDQSSETDLAESVKQLADVPLTYRLGGHDEAHFTQTDLVVASPAVPPSHPMLAAAKSAGVPITTEIALFAQACPLPIVGVTGTKGKSTTTALLHRMLAAKRKVWMGGNIGRSLLMDLPEIQAAEGTSALVLLELSSYMLHYLGGAGAGAGTGAGAGMGAGFSPHVAVVTMISADHLDWHGSLESYVEAKRQIVAHQRPGDVAVLYRGNASAQAFAASTPAAVRWYDAASASQTPVPLLLPGSHNQLNAQAALAAATALDISYADACQAVSDFTGLPHRLQLVHQHNNIRWVNDSIATMPDAALAGLNAFEPNTVIQIVGGYDKKLDMSPLTAGLKLRAKAVLGIGQLGASLVAGASGGSAKTQVCDTLQVAVETARQLAKPGDVVLLSPGCASYDQFTHFEQRGQAFINFVHQLHR